MIFFMLRVGLIGVLRFLFRRVIIMAYTSAIAPNRMANAAIQITAMAQPGNRELVLLLLLLGELDIVVPLFGDAISFLNKVKNK
jgi:hypothetical protein